MPLYAKFLKEILSKKRKIAEEGIVNLTATCSADSCHGRVIRNQQNFYPIFLLLP